ncbi:MAG: hypothetical protein R3D71_10330 [Rickettsiales bacterium]
MTIRIRKFIISSIAIITLFSQPLYADKPEKHGKSDKWYKENKKSYNEYKKHKEHHSDARHHDGKYGVNVSISFNDNQRRDTYNYLSRKYGKPCPPGLAKKHNGCLPPGQVKKYRVGYPLMYGGHDIPRDLYDILQPAPYGYRYVMVDKDVLLISEGTKKVIDAITLFSSVGK